MSVIEDLEIKVQSLGDRLSAAQQSLMTAKLEKCPIKVGTIVIMSACEYQVTHIDVSHDYLIGKENWQRPALYGRRKLKNGEWGNQVRALYRPWTVKP